jgi:Conserved TM helix
MNAHESLAGSLLNQLQAIAPKAALCLGILVGGLLLSALARKFAVWLVRRSGLEALVERSGGSKVLYKVGIKDGIVTVVRAVVWYCGMLATFAVLADALALPSLERGITTVIAFLPKLFAAVALLAAGLWAASAVKGLVQRLTRAPGEAAGSTAMAQLASVLTLVLSAMVALGQLGLDLGLLTSLIQMALGATVLAFALAFALGGAKVFEHLIARHYVGALISPGDRIKVGDVEGVVVRISAVAVIVASSRGEHAVPCSRALESTMEIRRLGSQASSGDP